MHPGWVAVAGFMVLDGFKMTAKWLPRSFQAALAAACAMCLIVAVGCWTTSGPESPPGQASAPAELFPGWEAPLAVLVLTGDQHGYLEPCGCSDKQAGGFARRADLLRQLREERGWNVVPIDGGGMLRTDRVLRDQSRVKLAAILNGLGMMQYAAVGVGYEELLYGPAELNEAYFNASSQDDRELPFVSSNVVLFGTRTDELPPREYRVIEAGSLKIGITSVLTETVRDELDRSGITSDPNLVSISPAVEALPGTIEALREAGAELLVLLSHGTIEDSRALAEQFPQFQIVVTARSAEDPLKTTQTVGSTLFCEVGQKGKNAAVVGIFRTSEGKLGVKHTLIEIQKDYFANHPAMTELMREYQAGLSAQQETILGASIADPEQGQFVGVDQCKQCHTKAYAVWSKSQHAKAYESLIHGRKGWEGEWVPRPHDPECLNCHTTGWDPQDATRFASGFISLEKTPHLAGQQCENCHGPGSRHVAAEQIIKGGTKPDEAAFALRAAMRLNRQTAEKIVCKKCHDYENSPNFNFDQYWSKVNHPGKD